MVAAGAGNLQGMDSVKVEPVTRCHVVAMPYPGRGHINPMMNLCKLLASRNEEIIISFVVTEEWLGFIGSESKPANIQFRTIPNVIPSELVRAADISGFIEATATKMEGPFEELLDQLEPPATTIIFDTYLCWVVEVGNRRNIPVASFWTMSASVLSVFHHFDLLVQNGHFPANLSERGDERVDYIPGVSSTRLADLATIINDTNSIRTMLPVVHKAFSLLSKSQYLLLTSVNELESRAIDSLKLELQFPIYSIGPCIPYFKLNDDSFSSNTHNDLSYFQWLNLQPNNSVLYISMGSFLSFSSAQIDEIAAGLRKSGVRYLWIARGETSRLKDVCGDNGLVLPWCDQLRVLSHSSIGGFWSHCGWSSTMEGVFTGVPFLTLPIIMDQVPNSKLIVEDWKVGLNIKREVGENALIKRNEIAKLVKRFMNLESDEGKEMRRRARELWKMSQQAIADGGSSATNINAFIKDISRQDNNNLNR